MCAIVSAYLYNSLRHKNIKTEGSENCREDDCGGGGRTRACNAQLAAAEIEDVGLRTELQSPRTTESRKTSRISIRRCESGWIRIVPCRTLHLTWK